MTAQLQFIQGQTGGQNSKISADVGHCRPHSVERLICNRATASKPGRMSQLTLHFCCRVFDHTVIYIKYIQII